MPRYCASCDAPITYSPKLELYCGVCVPPKRAVYWQLEDDGKTIEVITEQDE